MLPDKLNENVGRIQTDLALTARPRPKMTLDCNVDRMCAAQFTLTVFERGFTGNRIKKLSKVTRKVRVAFGSEIFQLVGMLNFPVTKCCQGAS